MTLAAASAALAAAAWAAPVTETGSRVVISREDCRRLVPHRPAPGVAYQPGIDAEGRPVVPAELPDGTGATAGQVVIDLRPPDQHNFPSPSLSRSDVYLGRVVVGLTDGRVTLNGQPLDAPERALIQDACARAGLR